MFILALTNLNLKFVCVKMLDKMQKLTSRTLTVGYFMKYFMKYQVSLNQIFIEIIPLQTNVISCSLLSHNYLTFVSIVAP